jgi:hypothetical protein
LGGDLASTWVAKLEVHAEDVIILVNNMTNFILAKAKRKSAVVNDAIFPEDVVVAKAA